jgi:hypothetical protein
MKKNTDTNKSGVKRGKKNNDAEKVYESINKDMTPNIQVFIEDEIITDKPNSSSEHQRPSTLHRLSGDAEERFLDSFPRIGNASAQPSVGQGCDLRSPTDSETNELVVGGVNAP